MTATAGEPVACGQKCPGKPVSAVAADRELSALAGYRDLQCVPRGFSDIEFARLAGTRSVTGLCCIRGVACARGSERTIEVVGQPGTAIVRSPMATARYRVGLATIGGVPTIAASRAESLAGLFQR